jgi:hypothetical protein
MRRKNPRPKRAVNARTVLKGEKEEPNLVLCLKIPDEREEMRKEKTARKRGKRKRGTSAMFARRCFNIHPT